MPESWTKAARRALSAAPGIRLDVEAFGARLQQAAAESGGLGAVNAADLLLAFATLNGDATATRTLDGRLVRAVRVSGARFEGLAIDDLEQLVRQRVLIGNAPNGPKLARYTGRGTIDGWLKAVATSIAIDESRRLHPELRANEDDAIATASVVAGPEHRLLKAQHQHHFNLAFRHALTELTALERTVLRMRFVDQLAVEEIATAFTVHRTTAMRWLEKAQKGVLAATRSFLAKRLGLSRRDLDSLLREVQPSLSDRLSRLLAPVVR